LKIIRFAKKKILTNSISISNIPVACSRLNSFSITYCATMLKNCTHCFARFIKLFIWIFYFARSNIFFIREIYSHHSWPYTTRWVVSNDRERVSERKYEKWLSSKLTFLYLILTCPQNQTQKQLNFKRIIIKIYTIFPATYTCLQAYFNDVSRSFQLIEGSKLKCQDPVADLKIVFHKHKILHFFMTQNSNNIRKWFNIIEWCIVCTLQLTVIWLHKSQTV
jgi:hypothetical protein